MSFAVLVLLGLTTQASVAEGPASKGSAVATRSDGVAVRLAAGADTATAEEAASNPQAVAAASTVCGGSYNSLAYIDASLPGDTGAVSGSMAAYVGGGYLCIVFYNQTPGGANWMYLQACPGTTSSSACGYDSGTFSSYAGPVYITTGSGGCFTVAYLLETEAKTGYLVNGRESYSC